MQPTTPTTGGSSPRSAMSLRSRANSTIAVRRLQPCWRVSRNELSGKPGTVQSRIFDLAVVPWRPDHLSALGSSSDCSAQLVANAGALSGDHLACEPTPKDGT